MFLLIHDSVALVVTLGYLVLVTGTGAWLTSRLPLSSYQQLPAAFVAGSAVLGVTFSLLAVAQLVSPLATLVVVGISCLLTALSMRRLRSGWQGYSEQVFQWKSHLSRRDKAILCGLLAIVLVYILLSLTPPRSADAMRYHLAQLKDIVQSHGLVFRPYVHYNFPLYFSMLLLPVYQACGGVGVQVAHCVCLFLAASLTVAIARPYGVRHPIWLVFALLSLPLCYHEAHEACNDWAVVLYALAALYLTGYTAATNCGPDAPRRDLQTLTESIGGPPATLGGRRDQLDEQSAWALLVGCMALGFGLGIKYHTVLFVPWLAVAAWPRLISMIRDRRIAMLGMVIVIPAVMAAPWYVRNWLNTGNPCWPLMLGVFPGESDYLSTVAAAYAAEHSGVHSLASLIESIKLLTTSPYIPGVLWILAAIALIHGLQRDPLNMRFGLPCFFVFWWFLQPQWYLRFSIFVVPFALILVGVLLDRLRVSNRPVFYRACSICLVLIIVYGVSSGVWYSSKYLAYYAKRDLADYHRATWFYDEYDWINRFLQQSDRLLVIVTAGQTYYLDRSYVRADPGLSGAVPWPEIATSADLQQCLKQHGISHILYEDRDWRAAPGGTEMMRAIQTARQNKLLKTQWERSVRLCTSFVRNRFVNSRVLLLTVDQDDTTSSEQAASRRTRQQQVVRTSTEAD